MENSKITPSLWYHTEDGKLSPVIDYYQVAFSENLIPGGIIPLGDTPSGYAEMAYIWIFGQSYSMMSTSQPHDSFNDAMALTLSCKDQQEIDYYWDYFTAEGKEVMCGWCTDKYGLRWQILPENLSELMQKPGAQEVMMRQKKIIIDEY